MTFFDLIYVLMHMILYDLIDWKALKHKCFSIIAYIYMFSYKQVCFLFIHPLFMRPVLPAAIPPNLFISRDPRLSFLSVASMNQSHRSAATHLNSVLHRMGHPKENNKISAA